MKFVSLWAKNAGIINRAIIVMTGNLHFVTIFPMRLKGGTNGRCFVLSIQLYNNKVKAGKKIITVMKLNKIPFTRLKPKSEPISNCMNDKAIKPKKVVDALAAIAGKERLIAKYIACSGFSPAWR